MHWVVEEGEAQDTVEIEEGRKLGVIEGLEVRKRNMFAEVGELTVVGIVKERRWGMVEVIDLARV